MQEQHRPSTYLLIRRRSALGRMTLENWESVSPNLPALTALLQGAASDTSPQRPQGHHSHSPHLPPYMHLGSIEFHTVLLLTPLFTQEETTGTKVQSRGFHDPPHLFSSRLPFHQARWLLLMEIQTWTMWKCLPLFSLPFSSLGGCDPLMH